MVELPWIIIEQLGPTILTHIKGDIFEIGIGPNSTPMFKKFAEEFKRDLYCLDQKRGRCKWARELGGCKVFHARSLKTIKELPELSFAMGLVDGRHEANTVRQEMYYFLDRLALGGIIFMHDTYLLTDKKIRNRDHKRGPAGDVYKIRQELESDKTLRTFTWPYTAGECGLTMVMKKDPDRPYWRK